MSFEDELRSKIGHRRFEAFKDETPKQQLLTLRNAGFLTPLQTKAAARRMDQLTAAGDHTPKEALVLAMAELHAGRLRVGARDPRAKANILKLEQLRKDKPNLPKSQQLLELRNAGSISPVQTKAAAALLRKGLTVEQALVEVGAQAALETLPQPTDAEKDDEDTGEGEGTEGEGTEGVGEGQSATGSGTTTSPPEQAGKPVTLGGLLEGTEDEVKDALPKIKAPAAVKQLWILEQQGKKRKGVSHLIRERGEELGLTDDDFDQVAAVHEAVTKPGDADAAGEAAYKDHIEGE